MLTARRTSNEASMNRPLVPEDDPRVKHARGAVYVYRAAAAHLRSFVTGATPANAAKAMFGNDGVTDIVLRAANDLTQRSA
jgi:hypothetical protein